jgi:hypothetical protein
MFPGVKCEGKNFVPVNLFISLCAIGMIFTTFLMNDVPIRITPFTLFLTSATYVLYNFHLFSSRFNYKGLKEFKASFTKILIHPAEKILFLIAFFTLLVSFFFLHADIYFFLLPLAIFTISYTIPIIRYQKRKIRLVQIPMLKTPAIAIVWGITTTVFPLLEQNVSVFSSFVILQMISRSLFVFALCIPFEIRDVESDLSKNIHTMPVKYGVNKSRIIGVILVFIEILLHHMMSPLSPQAIFSLDLSSIVAMIWIITIGRQKGIYYYRLLVDGTMLVRFLFLFIAIHRL